MWTRFHHPKADGLGAAFAKVFSNYSDTEGYLSVNNKASLYSLESSCKFYWDCVSCCSTDSQSFIWGGLAMMEHSLLRYSELPKAYFCSICHLHLELHISHIACSQMLIMAVHSKLAELASTEQSVPTPLIA